MGNARARFERLLVPVDLSAVSRHLVDFVLEFARPFRPRVELLYVWRTNTDRRVTVAREDARQALDTFWGQFASSGFEMRATLEYGDPYMTITSVAQLGGYDALVLPGVNHEGSLPACARRLAYTSRVPSLLVPAAWWPGSGENGRVLIPASMALKCQRSLRAALGVSERLGALLEVLCPPSLSPAERSALDEIASPGVIELRKGEEDLSSALRARVTYGNYRLVVLTVRGGAIGQDVPSSESDALLQALRACPALVFREE